VELIRIEGGGHTIPGRRNASVRGAALGAQNNDIDTARVMVDFFRRNRR
jgi:polyhydroxybutyrate depolymerase